MNYPYSDLPFNQESKLAKAADAQKEVVLPVVKNGEHVRVRKVSIVEKATRAPAPYTEATLLADMEGAAKFVDDAAFKKVLKRTTGLGTPATQASIIEGLKDSGLIKEDKKHLLPTEKGVALIEWLPPECYDVARTARWETELALIEKTGEDFHFLTSMRSDTARIVNTLKEKPPMSVIPAGAARPSSGKPSSGGSGGGGGVPTEKMVALATSLAEKLKVKLPKGLKSDFVVCRKFIDDHINVTPPSDKALAFAESIAARKKITIPDDVRSSAKKLSAWLDENK